MLKKSFLVNTLLGSFIAVTASITSTDAAISSNLLRIAPSSKLGQEHLELMSYQNNQGLSKSSICLLQSTFGYAVASGTTSYNLQRSYSTNNKCSTLQVGQALNSNLVTQNIGFSTKSLKFSPNRKVRVTTRTQDGNPKTMEGIIKISRNTVVTYSYREGCKAAYSPNTIHIEYQATFSPSGKWSQRFRNLGDCLGTADKIWRQDWIKGQFRIDPNGKAINADALDDDGSLLLENALLIRQ